jgi:hypothetical protein
LGEHRNPYLTVLTVWLVSAFWLALMISFPIFYVILFLLVLSLFLVLSRCLVSKAFNRKLTIQDLAQNLLSEAQLLLVRTFDDFRIVSARVSTWWLRREAQVQEEMIRKHERIAKKKEKLKELKQKRNARPVEEDILLGEHEAYKELPNDQPSAKDQ